jgi:hypothetical protein
MSPSGGRLAVIRRDESGLPSLEVLSANEPGWTSVGSRSLSADGPISIAWLR